MWGGRGVDEEDKEKDDVEVGGGKGQGEVFAGAGRSGGGEESVGDPLAEATGPVAVVVGPPCVSSCSCLVSMTMDSGAAAVSVW